MAKLAKVEVLFSDEEIETLEDLAMEQGVSLRELFSLYPGIVLQQKKMVNLAEYSQALADIHGREASQIFNDHFREAMKRKSARAFSVPEVAEMLGVTPKTIRKYIDQGKIKAFRSGRNWKVDKAYFLDYLETLKEGAQPMEEKSE